ncbi:MAG: penicillin-binding protein [Patescibacteria group bacterium]|nr:MAG: penicillin-binding protein [Patescibacteria group bacterium]
MQARVKIVFYLFLIWLFIVLIRLFHFQVMSKTLNSANVFNKKLSADRGKIYSSNGSLLAVNEKIYTLYFDKSKTEDWDSYAQELSSLLELDPATVSARIKKYSVWVPIKNNLSLEQKLRLEQKIDTKPLYFEEGYSRFYPEASDSAHLTGFVGKNSKGENVGYFGVEGYYNDILTGLSGVFKSERGGGQLPLIFGLQEVIKPINGADLYLTVDKGIQSIVKKRTALANERYGAKLGCSIVAEVATLKIKALSCLPDYDPNDYQTASPSAFINPTVSNVYEPGSIFKPLVVAMALEEKKITPETVVDESGPVQFGQYFIRTWDNKYEGQISITRVLQRSSNVGMIRIQEKLGNDLFYEYLDRFGFLEKTGIDLQGEVSSVIKPKKNWYPIDYAVASFGQGIAVTPIQMITAFDAIINNGVLLKPYVVEKIMQGDKTKIIKPQQRGRVVSVETSQQIRKLLVEVVKGGEVKWDVPDGYLIGGKTGTAQIAVEGKYDPEKTLASFIGFFPADQPKFIVMTMLKEPSASIWGSETAAPLFFEIVKDLILYYNIASSY